MTWKLLEDRMEKCKKIKCVFGGIKNIVELLLL
jgi:hypothetical protein